MAEMPDIPAVRAFQVASRLWPRAVIAPKPVIATLRGFHFSMVIFMAKGGLRGRPQGTALPHYDTWTRLLAAWINGAETVRIGMRPPGVSARRSRPGHPYGSLR